MRQHVTAHYVAGSLDLVWMSVLHKMNTESICSVLTTPLPLPLHYSSEEKRAARRERGTSSQDPLPALVPVINPAQPAAFDAFPALTGLCTPLRWDGQVVEHR